MTEGEFETFLIEALEDYAEDADAPLGRIVTFDEAGVLTNNKGLVVRIGEAEFQITIVRSRLMRSANQRPPLMVQIGAVGLRARWLAVADFAAASRACHDFIEANDLGASAWRGGRIVEDATKKGIVTVSYNGRVWLDDGTEAQLGKTS